MTVRITCGKSKGTHKMQTADIFILKKIVQRRQTDWSSSSSSRHKDNGRLVPNYSKLNVLYQSTYGK